MAFRSLLADFELTRARVVALCVFAASLVLVGGLVAMPDQARSLVGGPMTHGHETLSCGRCHRPAPGTMRQQVQANILHWVGLRATAAAFGHEPVDAGVCRGCHVRDNDRHPSFRFREPRFATINKSFDARTCLTCHTEHIARRVANDGTFCARCHDGMKARHEKLSPTHAELAAHKQWTTCLTCHDFHGNHDVKAPKSLDDAHDLRAIRAYLADGPDPYARSKIHRAKTDPAKTDPTKTDPTDPDNNPNLQQAAAP